MAEAKGLNLKQKKFAELYASDQEFFGNGVQAYIEAYQPDQSRNNWYKTACVCASQLLSNLKVCEYINQLLEEGGLNDSFVDKQLKFLITQHTDFRSKLGAVKEYNTLKKRTAGSGVNVNIYETKDKIKGFLDESDDSAYNEAGAQPTSSDVTEDNPEV